MNHNPSVTRAQEFLDLLLLLEDVETLAHELIAKTNERTVSVVKNQLLELYQHMQGEDRKQPSLPLSTDEPAAAKIEEIVITKPPLVPKPWNGRLIISEDATTTTTDDDTTTPLPYNLWKHTDGIVRPVPEDWKFPFCTLDQAYVWWHCGDDDTKIGPLKECKSIDFRHVPRGIKNFTEIRNLMIPIDDLIQQQGLWQQDASQALVVFRKFQTLHEHGKGAFLLPDSPSGRPRGPLDKLKWTTIVRIIYETKRMKAESVSLLDEPPHDSHSSCDSSSNNSNIIKRARLEDHDPFHFTDFD